MDLNFGAFDCDRLLFAVYSQLFRTPSALRSRIGVLNSPLQKLKGLMNITFGCSDFWEHLVSYHWLIVLKATHQSKLTLVQKRFQEAIARVRKNSRALVEFAQRTFALERHAFIFVTSSIDSQRRNRKSSQKDNWM